VKSIFVIQFVIFHNHFSLPDFHRRYGTYTQSALSRLQTLLPVRIFTALKDFSRFFVKKRGKKLLSGVYFYKKHDPPNSFRMFARHPWWLHLIRHPFGVNLLWIMAGGRGRPPLQQGSASPH
jgi:hypothetical protein